MVLQRVLAVTGPLAVTESTINRTYLLLRQSMSQPFAVPLHRIRSVRLVSASKLSTLVRHPILMRTLMKHKRPLIRRRTVREDKRSSRMRNSNTDDCQIVVTGFIPSRHCFVLSPDRRVHFLTFLLLYFPYNKSLMIVRSLCFLLP
jgi:hypothetical protein